MDKDKEKDPHPEQAADDIRAPGQKTPSRSYGRQDHASGEETDADDVGENAQEKGDGQQTSGSPSA